MDKLCFGGFNDEWLDVVCYENHKNEQRDGREGGDGGVATGVGGNGVRACIC